MTSGSLIEICNRDPIRHKPFMLIEGQSGVKYLNVTIPKHSCEKFRAPEVEKRTIITIACELHVDEKARVVVLPHTNGPTIAKTPFVEECMAGNLGGEPQSAIACGCFYDKLANEASVHAREAMFIGARDGLVAQQAYAEKFAVGTELMEEVFGFMNQCSVSGDMPSDAHPCSDREPAKSIRYRWRTSGPGDLYWKAGSKFCGTYYYEYAEFRRDRLTYFKCNTRQFDTCTEQEAQYVVDAESSNGLDEMSGPVYKNRNQENRKSPSGYWYWQRCRPAIDGSAGC